MQEIRPRLLMRNRDTPFPVISRVNASIAEDDSTLKNAIGPAFMPISESKVAKKPIVPHKTPAARTNRYPLFCSDFILIFTLSKWDRPVRRQVAEMMMRISVHNVTGSPVSHDGVHRIAPPTPAFSFTANPKLPACRKNPSSPPIS